MDDDVLARPDPASGRVGGPVVSPWAPPAVAECGPGRPGAALGLAAATAEHGQAQRLRRRPGGRHCQVKLRLSDGELERFQEAANMHGLTVQRYLVEVVLAKVAAPRRPLLGRQQRALLATFMATRRTLAGAANNLNQMTRWSHGHEQTHPDFAGVAVELDAAVARLGLDTAALVDGLVEEAETEEWEGS